MVLRGTMAEKSRGMVKILEMLDLKDDKFSELMIPANKTRNVIGRGGDTINWICKTTGCNVQVQKCDTGEMPTRFVTFEGSLEERVKAALMVLVAIELSFMPTSSSPPEEPESNRREHHHPHQGEEWDRNYSPGNKKARHQADYQSHGRSTESPRGHRGGGSHSYEAVSESWSEYRRRGSLDNAAVQLGTAADRLGSDVDHDEASYFSVVVGRNTVNSWVKAGFLDELSRRSGAHIEIGKDVPQTMDRQLLLSGTILQNSLACLYIQAKLLSGYHPDRNPDDPEAQTRMASLTDAYAILTDPKKRAMHDREQRDTRNGSSGSTTASSTGAASNAGDWHHDPSQMFSEFSKVFGRQAKYRQAGQVSQRGDDITTEIEVSFMEAMRGSTRTVALSCRQGCDTCNGSGAAAGTGWTMCRQCKGTGTVRVERGIMTMGMPCNTCSGSGQTLDHPCRSCRGEGAMVRRKDVLVSIPAGARQFTELRLPGLGHCGLRGGRSGDLFVTIKVKEHDRFRRVDEDVHLTVPVTLCQALLGGTVEIPSLTSDKDIIKLQIPPNTLPGNSRIIRGKGPPKLIAGKSVSKAASSVLGSSTDSSSNPRGNLVLHFSLSLPERLSPRQEAIIREFDEIEQEARHRRSSGGRTENTSQDTSRKAAATAE
ncbi:hypothetical protein FOL47_000726 [Perkinsus chesapeaki]|uniref:Uncharacterized protein n=1 Tax=Perkinsus chesapeaki TaxID=330153 RepID=A0A7J6MMU3_PERCH|nr:hypothetical protein FOL47_000726 [Perkinsus chesapeaki]